MRSHLASCLLVLLVARATSAQGKPDFSGDWILVSPIDAPSSAAQTMTVHESFERESVRSTPLNSPAITLAVERRSSSGVHSDLYTVGTVGGTVGGGVGKTDFSTTWDGDRLVIQIRYSGRPVDAGADSERKEVWSLDAQGSLLLTATDRGPGAQPTTTTLIYRRRP